MNNKLLKLLPVIPVLILLLFLTGCGGSDTEADTQSTPAPEYIYASERLFSVAGTKDNAAAAQPAAITDSGYYAIGGVYDSGNTPEGAVAEYEGQFDSVIPCISFVRNDGTVSTLDAYEPVLPESVNEGMRDYRVNNSIEALKLRPDGKLILAESMYISWCDAGSEVKYGSDAYYEALKSESSWWIRVLKPDGGELSRAKLNISEDDGISFYTCTLDDKGNLIASRDTGLVAFNIQGERAYEIKCENEYIYGLANTAEGKAAALTGYYTMSMRLIDSDNGGFEDKSYPVGIDAAAVIDGSGDYDLYINSGTGFFGYDLESEQSTKLFSWIDCDMSADRMAVVCAAPDGSVKAVSVNYDTAEEKPVSELIVIKKIPYDPAFEKKSLTIATLYPNETMLDQIIDFNRSHKDIRIELLDYSEYGSENEDYPAGCIKLMTEIAAGDMPDILDLSPDLPYTRYAANGILIDLYPYLEKDAELSKDDLFENVLEAMEVNGGLYMANAGFGIFTAAGAVSVVGDEAGMTYGEYFEALERMPEGCEGFDVGYDRETALSMSVALEFPKLVNWSTGECRFDSEDFIDILNYAAQFGKFDSESYEPSLEDASSVRVAEGRQMLAEVIMTSVNYMLTDCDSMFGGKATVVGFPCSEGAGHMLYMSNGLAITSKCAAPDTAWEFVRTYFTEEYQKKQYEIPTNKNVFEAQLAKAMEVKYETDANGNYKLDENGERIPRSYGYYYDGTSQVNIYAISEKQAEMLRSTLEGSTRLLNFDKSIDDIVTEGAQAFFEGQKNAEECARLIQSKVNIYVNEQK